MWYENYIDKYRRKLYNINIEDLKEKNVWENNEQMHFYLTEILFSILTILINIEGLLNLILIFCQHIVRRKMSEFEHNKNYF